ncbi:Transcription factor bHLH94 [Hibiscus syriacus]|uniref:Transcription factor bHLH94 n=1 Tax=Hibiscus syriacus TaxID=106335 RepID=A0A6A2YXS7_HIBSY|nr:transcription factor bHLH94-like [Hibiscus syriacus]KAE8684130.1 Transcription factor bHLH94 [Hibiscus syriacus]
MALEAVVFQQDSFNHINKDLYSLLEGNSSYEGKHFPHQNQASNEANNDFVNGGYWVSSSSRTSIEATNNGNGSSSVVGSKAMVETASTRPKRRRFKTRRNKEEIENQRMTHIAVERNRRRQMNEYLSVLRSLIPQSYVQRGDQASVIGGAINFVKELEHCVQLLTAKKDVKERSDGSTSGCSSPFDEFFMFPQYSTPGDNYPIPMNESTAAETRSARADIEVTMVESHANLKIRLKNGPAQLLKLVSGLNSMRLSILHLNVTTVDHTVLYSLSVQVEDDCKVTAADDIATALNQLLGRIQEDAVLNCFSFHNPHCNL